MATPPLTREAVEATVSAYLANGSNQCRTADALDVSRGTVQHHLRYAARWGMLGTDPVLPGYRIAQTSTVTDADGNVVRQAVVQKPDTGEGFSLPPGHRVKGISTLLDAEGRTSAQWIKTTAGADPAALTDALRDTLAGYAAPAIPAPDTTSDDLLTVYVLPDLHLGMRAWARETGEDYDLEIATQSVRAAAGELVAQSRPTKHAIVLGLGDYFHSNDQRNATPASGHQLDVDGRWPKVLRTGVQLAADLVHLVAQKHDQVTARFLPGNHDPDAAAALTVALGLFFRSTPRIAIDESPSLHFYHRFGRVLLGATHGHTMKPEGMAMMLAADRPDDWGVSRFRHFFFGHIHHVTAKEVGSVWVESFSSPAARDAYAAGGGWRSGRRLTAITFHAEDGQRGRHFVNL